MTNVAVEHVNADHEDLLTLIQKLDHYLEMLYPPEEIFTVDFTAPSIQQTFFAVAYVGGQPAGCGAIRPLNEHEVELKRFYVEPFFRRIGVAARILRYLEERARELQMETIKLETGIHQPESIHFYRRMGFVEITSFGEYANCQTSVCFGKKL